jgi:hypothetical protein
MKIKVFISYARADSPFVERLCAELEARNLQIWLDVKDIKVGDSIVSRIEDGIRDSDVFCLILSPASSSRPWVLKEYRTALNRQLSTDGKDIRILPILIKDCEIPGLLQDIRYADFTRSFIEGIEEVLDALRLESNRKAPYYELTSFIEERFQSVPSFIEIVKKNDGCHGSADFRDAVDTLGELKKPKKRVGESVSYQEAVRIRILLWGAIGAAQVELEEYLQKGARLLLLRNETPPKFDRKSVCVAISSGLRISYGASGDDELWSSISGEFAELLELLQVRRAEVFAREVFLVPEFCKATWEDNHGGMGSETIDLSRIISQVKQ